jgi:hypothetical protein
MKQDEQDKQDKHSNLVEQQCFALRMGAWSRSCVPQDPNLHPGHPDYRVHPVLTYGARNGANNGSR